MTQQQLIKEALLFCGHKLSKHQVDSTKVTMYYDWKAGGKRKRIYVVIGSKGTIHLALSVNDILRGRVDKQTKEIQQGLVHLGQWLQPSKEGQAK